MAEGLLDSAVPRGRMAVGDWFVETLLAERDRWPLWIPVAMAVGIASYFALPMEPAL